MRNYVIINGVNSLDIQGLAINNLPPITKPMIRTQREEIDGRDGDLITELGYSAYDKQIEIGLYGNFEIDDVIAYFNSEGTVTFSNEPDKYYNYQIIEQIDFEKLIRFKTAKVRMHVQPFKYPLEETPIEIAYQYVNNEAEEMDLDNTADAPMQLVPKGNTSQETTTGKNMINYSMINEATLQANGYYRVSFPNGTTILSGVFETNQQYTLSFNGYGVNAGNNGRFQIYYTDSTFENVTVEGTTARDYLFTSPANKTIDVIKSSWGSAQVTYLKDLQLEKGTSKTSFEPYTNGASPNPDYPQEVKTVTGDNTIKVEGKNLFDENQLLQAEGWTYSNGYYNGLVEKYYVAFRYGFNFNTTFEENTQYTIKLNAYTTGGNPRFKIEYTDGTSYMMNFTATTPTDYSYTTTSSKTISKIVGEYGTGGGQTLYLKNIQLEKGTTATDYEPYQSQSYAVNLGTMELCKIGDYQDYIYKDNGSWYLHKEIGKIDLGEISYVTDTSSQSLGKYYKFSATSYNFLRQGNYYDTAYQMLCETYRSVRRRATDVVSGTFFADGTATNVTEIQFKNDNISTSTDFKTSMSGKHLYYPLETPTTTEITDNDLIIQLEAINNARSYDTTTHITQNANKKPFMLNATAIKKGTDTGVVDNIGNIYSKPTIDIEGSGTVEIYLENNQIFSVDLSNNSECVIDTTKLEAYDPSTSALMNRQVTGDYSNFKLAPGENDLRFSGDLTKATVTRYIRWI